MIEGVHVVYFILALVIALVLIFLIYLYGGGWTYFEFGTSAKGGAATNGAEVKLPLNMKEGDSPHNMVFSGCKFTSTCGTTSQSINVTKRMNAMIANSFARPKKVNGSRPPAMTCPLTLLQPVNAFSFTIAGWNDMITVPSPQPAKWATSTGLLVGYYRM